MGRMVSLPRDLGRALDLLLHGEEKVYKSGTQAEDIERLCLPDANVPESYVISGLPSSRDRVTRHDIQAGFQHRQASESLVQTEREVSLGLRVAREKR
jgi:hypothetical protein